MTNGSTQSERLPPALSPDEFLVDETSLNDLLAMGREYASALTFISSMGQPDGTWADLFDRSESILMARCLSLRLERRNLTLLDDFAGARTREMARHLEDLAGWLKRWFEALWRIEGSVGAGVSARLERQVLRGLGPEMTAVAGLGPVDTLDEFGERLAAWLGTGSSSPHGGSPERPAPALRELRRIYFALIEALRRLQTAAALEFARTLGGGDQEPAAALFVATAQTLQRVQQRVNQFTGRHLHFYYKDCLGFTPLPATPDSAYLVFERDKAFAGEVIIPAGQSFVAGQTAGGAPIIFQADDTLAVSDAQVAQLKTLRMERNPLISPDGEFGYVTRAKAASYKAEISSADPLQRRPAPLMGGDVLGCLPDDADARIGLAVSSPILWLKEGERFIDLRLDFSIFPPGASGAPADPDRKPEPESTDGAGRKDQDFTAGLIDKLEGAKDAPSFHRALGDLFAAWLLSDQIVLREADVATIRNLPNRAAPYIRPERLGDGAVKAFEPRAGEAPEETNRRKKEEQEAQDDRDIFLAHDLLTLMLGPIAQAELNDPALAGESDETRRKDLARAKRRILARDELYASAFLVELSTADGWFEITNAAPSTEAQPQGGAGGMLRMLLDLNNEDPPVVACTPAIHGAEWPTDAPVLRLTIHPKCRLFPLSVFDNATLHPVLSAVSIAVRVDGVKTMTAYNQQGQLDPTKPFQPFGPLPNTASYLVIGAPEAARKSISRHSLTLDWAGLPEEGFGDYYAGYGDAVDLSNGAFKVRESILRNGRWMESDGDQRLFTLDRQGKLIGRPLVLEHTPLHANWRASDQPLVFDQNARSGFVKLQLSAPREGFGQQLYPTVLADALRPDAKGAAPAPLPNPPYTPTVNRLTLSYAAETRIVFGDQKPGTAERVLHLHPFGVEEIYPAGQHRAHHVLPQFGRDGQLLIGLAADQLQGELNLFFDLREDTAVEALARQYPRSDLEWSWLTGDVWRPLDSRQVVTDTTKGFLTSGIVKLDLPVGLAKGAGILPGDLFWLRVCSDSLSAAFAGLQGAHAQAVRVTRVLGEAPSTPLPPRTINLKSASIPGLLTLEQPEAGFGLRRAETEQQTWTRIGERLRHKLRATTPWDYERLVLEQFPAVQKVRCLPNIDPRTGGSSRGEVLVVVVPTVPRNDPQYSTRGLQLDALELDRIAAYLPSLASPFAKISVRNATYDLIQVRCRVALRPGAHAGDVLKRINNGLVRYLSPWHDEGYAADFDWSVRGDDIEASIRAVDEVHSVSAVSLIRVWEDNSTMPNPTYQFEDTAVSDGAAIAVVSARRRWSLALPLPEHFIELVDGRSHADGVMLGPETTGVAASERLASMGLAAGLQVGDTFIVGGAPMTRRNRATLKNFFSPGSRPTRDQFGDLINSTLNMDDEGFSKTPADGLKVVTIKDELGLISFQRQLVPTVDWSLAFLDGTGKRLALKSAESKDDGTPPIVTFQSGGAQSEAGKGAQVLIQADLGVGVASPQHSLDVAGMVCADGRIGRAWQTPVKADGQFHPITPVLSGCVAFEIMAGVSGVKTRGRYALLHAVAMNANNPIWWDDLFGLKKRIRAQHAYYSRGSDRLQLSWMKAEDKARDARDPNQVHGMDAKFTLNIRTRSTYLDDDPSITIKAFVTRLWGDPAAWPRSNSAAGLNK